MDTLSVELHAQIFEYACVDDGSTARSLALVSRYIHAVAQPFLYQSLAVRGPVQIHALTSRLAPLPHYLRRIRHLYLAELRDDQAWPAGRNGDASDLEGWEAACAAIAQLLVLAAPTLETLALTADCPFTGTSIIGHLWSLHLPLLRELAVRGFYPFPAGADAEGATMPRLRRMYLAANRSPTGLLGSGGLKDACPLLEHLVIEGVFAAQGFANEVERIFGRESERGHARDSLVDGDEDSPLPSALRRVVIRPEALPPKSGIRVRAYHAKMTDLLERAAGGSGGRVVLRPPPVFEAEVTRPKNGRMYELWTERIAGGSAWWEDA